jgi:hypothetical protein
MGRTPHMSQSTSGEMHVLASTSLLDCAGIPQTFDQFYNCYPGYTTQQNLRTEFPIDVLLYMHLIKPNGR